MQKLILRPEVGVNWEKLGEKDPQNPRTTLWCYAIVISI